MPAPNTRIPAPTWLSQATEVQLIAAVMMNSASNATTKLLGMRYDVRSMTTAASRMPANRSQTTESTSGGTDAVVEAEQIRAQDQFNLTAPVLRLDQADRKR